MAMTSRYISIKLLLGLVAILVLGLLVFHVGNSLAVGGGDLAARIPERLDRYEVLFVTTPRDTPCTYHPEIYLKGSDPTVEAFLSSPGTERAEEELRKLGITERVILSVSGPGITKQDVMKIHEEWTQSVREYGCFTAGKITDKLDMASKVAIHPRMSAQGATRGYAYIPNLNAGQYSDDTAQSVELTAPATTGPNNTQGFAFLNNVWNNAATYNFIQDGLLFQGTQGGVVWTDYWNSLVLKPLGVPYFHGHTYWFTITRSTSSIWYACGYDVANPSTYTCKSSQSSGTNLVENGNTAVWIENANTASNWYSGWSSPLSGRNAKYYRGGNPYNWTIHAEWLKCLASGQQWPDLSSGGAITGTLTNNGIANWHLPYVPLAC
jgi:hypothetical protein